MAYSERAPWLVDAVRLYHHRNVIGARKQDFENFMGQLRISLREPIQEPDQTRTGKNVVDIDSKEFRNNGTESDTFTIRTQKTSTVETKKNYQLNVGKTVTIGGEAGLNVGANFFNVGNFGISAKGSASRAKTKETMTGEENTRGLSQEYGIIGEIVVPPKTRVEVRITTFAVSYTTTAQIAALMPVMARLSVYAPGNGICGCCSNKYVTISAKQFLKIYTGKNEDPQVDESGRFYTVNYEADLQYLGELTKVDKQKEEPLEE